LPFFGFSNLCPVLVSESVRLICSVAVVPLKSTSSFVWFREVQYTVAFPRILKLVLYRAEAEQIFFTAANVGGAVTTNFSH
jgi:hypothetical protein